MEPISVSESSSEMIRLKKEKANFYSQDNFNGINNVGYDLGLEIKRSKEENVLGRGTVNTLNGIALSGLRKPKTKADNGEDKNTYVSDASILKELKRESIQNYMSRYVDEGKELSEKENDIEKERLKEGFDGQQLRKYQYGRNAINERLKSKSSHRWNKTKNKKIKKSKAVMGEVLDKISELQKSNTIENSDTIEVQDNSKEFNYKDKFEKYNAIYHSIYKSDCYFAEAVSKDTDEEKMIKAKAKKTYLINMHNMVMREKRCYEEENVRTVQHLQHINSREEANEDEVLDYTRKIGKIQERINYYNKLLEAIKPKIDEMSNLGVNYEKLHNDKLDHTTITMNEIEKEAKVTKE